ncbi:hypothetical protein AB0I55_08380 [Actinocatenispora sera]|uniref:Uncharacterized protein n=1 Tax=Actinocatenispora sera TaxID=390989 RepID=A0A810KT77_9ACTN|nr:hypothetical protein [Actinocatenispora sera]BCJ26027.1 hypothetical protein Asera_01350 [Actinocatenispora sera]
MRGEGAWPPHRGWGRGRGGAQPEPPSAADAAGWIHGRLPDEWFVEPPTITVDREEILIVGAIPPPEQSGDEPVTEAERAGAEQGRIARFREQTRDERIGIAQQIEHRYRRHASWGVTCGETRELFTTQSVPVMTRLRQPQRVVLDTLVDAGVARSRSEALAWCVRLVGEHADAWLGELRGAMSTVEDLRRKGPDLG